jgi:pantetheine-phosphate adenylyltransferase
MDLQELLNKWEIKCDIKILLSKWNESNRYYHNLNHLNDLIDQINEKKSTLSRKQYEKLIITSLFHDIIYEPINSDNEEKSAKFFIDCCINKSDPDILEIYNTILDTKNHKPSNNLSEIFIGLDMSIVEKDFNKLLEWERGIREEFKNMENYKYNRLKFLESLLDKYPNNTENLLRLIEWVKCNYFKWNYMSSYLKKHKKWFFVLFFAINY